MSPTGVPGTPAEALEGYVYESGPHRLTQCRSAGVDVREGPPRVSFGPVQTFIPEWAYAVCEGTAVGNDRLVALRRAVRDEELQQAVAAAWRLGGFAAAARLVAAWRRRAAEAST